MFLWIACRLRRIFVSRLSVGCGGGRRGGFCWGGRSGFRWRYGWRRPATTRSRRSDAEFRVQERVGVMAKAAVDAGKSAKKKVVGKTGLEAVSTQDIYRKIIRRYDADPTRDGLERTPERIEKSL